MNVCKLDDDKYIDRIDRPCDCGRNFRPEMAVTLGRDQVGAETISFDYNNMIIELKKDDAHNFQQIMLEELCKYKKSTITIPHKDQLISLHRCEAQSLGRFMGHGFVLLHLVEEIEGGKVPDEYERRCMKAALVGLVKFADSFVPKVTINIYKKAFLGFTHEVLPPDNDSETERRMANVKLTVQKNERSSSVTHNKNTNC